MALTLGKAWVELRHQFPIQNKFMGKRNFFGSIPHREAY
jgi:hypothetical protein